MAGRSSPRGLVLALGFTLLLALVGVAQPVAAAEPPGFSYFYTYAEMEAVIDDIVARKPNIARKFSIGQSYQGREIWGIKLTGNVADSTRGKPEIMINGLMHGRERASSELAIYMLRVLGNNYGLSGKLGRRVTRILDTRVVWIIPMVNPDGGEYDMSGGAFRKWRKNRQPNAGTSAVGTDLNRNFGYTFNCCGGSSAKPSSENYRGTGAWSAPETRAYRDFLASRRINGEQRITQVLSLHSAGRKVLYPYAYTRADVPSDMTADDRKAFIALAKGMASRNGYRAQQSGDWYIISGDQDDDAYGRQGIFALTIEMTPGKSKRYYPTLKELNADLKRNKGAILWSLEQADCPYRAAGLASEYCAGSANAQLYSQSVYDSSLVQPQQTNCWCVVASTRAYLRHIDSSITAGQAEINDYMTPLDKNDWTDPGFRDYLRCTSGSPSPSYAHDGRGMAWALWRYGSQADTQGFNEYTSTSQAQMNWSIVRGIRATGQPAGIIAARGKHAILAVGYRSALDPLDEGGQPNQILGFRVWDPWYKAGFGNWSGWPVGGFSGNSYITISDWNSAYFLPDRNEGPYYDGKYVAILRSSVAEPPSDNPAQSYGDWLYENPPLPDPDPDTETGATFALAQSTQTSATPSDSVALAVRQGLSDHDLYGDPELGSIPTTYTLGNSVSVTSLVRDIPSYQLVEIVAGGGVRAVALVRERGGGYVLGELRPTTGAFRLPTRAQLQSALSARGLRGTATLSWAWTEQPVSPFAPFLTGTSAAGRPAFVTPAGVVRDIGVARGFSERPN